MQSSLDEAMERIDAVLRAPDVRYWVKTALTDSLNRNCVDAARDAELLAQLLRDRANKKSNEERLLDNVGGLIGQAPAPNP